MNKAHLAIRSRRALGWTIAGYCALQAGVLGLVLAIPELREPVYGRKLMDLRSRLKHEQDRPLKIVAFGSSRTMNGLRGNLIEPVISERVGRPAVVFNMGVPASGPVGNLLYLHRLLDDGIKPDVAIFEVLPPFLYEEGLKRDVSECGWPTANLRYSELELVRRYGCSRQPMSHADWWLARSNSIYLHRFSLLTRSFPAILAPKSLQSEFDAMEADGWFELPAAPVRFCEKLDPATRRRATAKMLENYKGWLKDMKVSAAAFRPIIEALQVCRQRHIPAMLILMPEGPMFRSLYPPGSRAQVRSKLDAVSRAWNAPLIDASEWFPEETAFLDSHHQLVETATAFTQRLGKELLTLPAFAPGEKPGSKTGEAR